ncbi:hypothetical protein [Mucilaginibacter sp. 22184]|uniref:hypothetical protein n=1 Tax=Mucilaginibacter sp. 22184 TaxID=3453887 RepID=UPI003F84673B
MEEVFIDHLAQLYWQGYGEAFREDNPDAFYQQLAEFNNTYKTPKYAVSNPLFNGTGSSAIRPCKHSRHGKRGGNTGDLFAK